MLRRSLGVSETAVADTKVKPAPPIDPKLPEDFGPDFSELPIDDGKPRVILPDHLKNKISIDMEEISDEVDFDVRSHDEL